MENELDRKLEDVCEYYLEDISFEEFLEKFDLTPTEVFVHLFATGKINPVKLEELSNIG